MSIETYNFTDDFQDAILACLIRYPKEFYAFREIIKPEYFSGPSACDLVFRLLEYKKKYSEYPDFTTLANFAFEKATRVNPDQAKETLDYAMRLSGVSTKNKVAIRDLCIDFAKERALYVALRAIHAATSDGKANTINPVKLVENALAIGTNVNDLGISLFHDYEKVIRSTLNQSFGVHTGYVSFERIWKFGWGPGWLIVLLAPPKRFKTTLAINLALNIAGCQDVDVLYYACEISQDLAALRAITSLTGMTQEQMGDNIEKGIMLTRKSLSKKLWGNVFIKGYASKSASISDIRAHARQAISVHGLNPKAIVIDYAETVKPDVVDKHAPDWRQQSDIYTQARALGAEIGACVIMPDRCNRDTVDRAVPSMSSFQGSFEKAGIVDVAIGICATEAEYIQRRVRYFVFLNRHGEASKHFDGTIDSERMKMTVGTEIEYFIEDEDAAGNRRHSMRQSLSKRQSGEELDILSE
jgi:replicative DNA helicase